MPVISADGLGRSTRLPPVKESWARVFFGTKQAAGHSAPTGAVQVEFTEVEAAQTTRPPRERAAGSRNRLGPDEGGGQRPEERQAGGRTLTSWRGPGGNLTWELYK